MKAAVIAATRKLQIVDTPLPEPGPGEALLIAGGVCLLVGVPAAARLGPRT